MKILGLIMENNPFHKGHQYYIQEAINLVKPDYTIVITSGNYTMRGEFSIINKIDKTNVLLQNGIDFIFELPFMLSNHSADFFAYHTVKILNDLQITDLAFGCEDISLDELINYAHFSDSKIFNKYFQETYHGETSYKKHHFETYKHFFNDANFNLSKPNNTLAIQYIKQIKKINPNIRIHKINRIGDDDLESNIINNLYPSGTALRNLHINNHNILEYLPNYNYTLNRIDSNKILDLLKYRMLVQDNYNSNQVLNEGIANLIKNNLNNTISLNDLINKCVGTRYSASRIRRCILTLIMDTPNIPTSFSYNRLLGFNESKQEYFKLLKQKDIKIFSSLKTEIDENTNVIIETEKKASLLYDLVNNTNFYLSEYTMPIKYKGGNNER